MIIKTYEGENINVFKENDKCIVCNKNNQEFIINNNQDAKSLIECLNSFLRNNRCKKDNLTVRGME